RVDDLRVLLEVRHLLVQLGERAELRILRYPREIRSGDVGQRAACSTGRQLLLKVPVAEWDLLHLDPWMRLLKPGNDDLRQSLHFRRCGVFGIRMPEGDGCCRCP